MNSLPDSFITPTSNQNFQELRNMVSWSLGESSSNLGQGQSQLLENQSPHLSLIRSSMNNFGVNLSGNLNSNPGMDDNDSDDDCQLLEFISTFQPEVPPNGRAPPVSSSSPPLPEQTSRRSCKRKAVGADSGQSSGSGSSSSYFQPSAGPVWQQQTGSSSSIVGQTSQMNARPWLNMGPRETSRRNPRLWMNGANQLPSSLPSTMLPAEPSHGNASPMVSSYMNTAHRGIPVAWPAPSLPVIPVFPPNRSVLPQHPMRAPLRANPSPVPPVGQSEASRAAMVVERPVAASSSPAPSPWRAFTGAGEGRRNRLLSGIHNVLDLMRRGESLTVEEILLLDPSVLFGMAGAQDRHRDMRLDVDNMSYEELLALEERIGNVCTGLSEEVIQNNLKQRIYINDQVEREPCCICQEEYMDGDVLGMLECGHDYHADCIKQWLKQKNLCPVCKTTGLSTST